MATYLSPWLVPMFSVFLGFVLNALLSGSRLSQDRRAIDIEYRAKLLAVTEEASRRMVTIETTLAEIRHFCGKATAIFESTAGRLDRLEKRLDARPD